MSEERRFDLRIEFCSDWAIGNGSGRQGSIDRLIERDPDDLPYVPATTLRGLWRDAAEQLAFGLDEDKPEERGWAKLLPHLFGSEPSIDQDAETAPIPSRLSVSDVRFSEGERDFLKHECSRPLRRALTFIKPGVEIDRNTGAAKSDHLHFDEMARKGIELEGCAGFDWRGVPEPDANRAEAFAIAALKLIDRIGNKRRRGAGRCEVKAVDKSADPKQLDGKAPSILPLASDKPHASYDRKDGVGWTKYRLDIELKTHTLIADEVQGNLVTSLDHIPGTVLVPVAARILEDSGFDKKDIRAGFANGDIRVLPAYPAVEGARGIPVPAIWEREKDNVEGPDGRGLIVNRLGDMKNPDRQYKAMRAGFFNFKNPTGQPVFARIETAVRTHNSVDNVAQKPKQESGGGVYVYESLKPAQKFVSEIWLRGSSGAALTVKKPDSSIGRAKNAGYGMVQVSLSATATEYEDKGQGPIRLLLLSDMALPVGIPRSEIETAVEREYNVKVSVNCEKTDIRFRRHDGWIASWGKPHPSLVTLLAGSVISLEGGTEDFAKAIAENGLGARRGEGFGHVAVRHRAVMDEIDNKPLAKDSPVSSPERGAAPAGKFAELVAFLEQEAGKRAIGVWAEQLAAAGRWRRKRLGWKTKEPTMSQIGALRAVAGTLESETQHKAAIAYLQAQVKKNDGGWHRTAQALFEKPSMMAMRKFGFAREDRRKKLREDLARYTLAALFHAAMRYHKRAIEKGAADG